MTSSDKMSAPTNNHLQGNVLLLDDDPDFGQIMKTAASVQGIELSFYESLSEMGSFASLGRFDLIIIDYFLEQLTGDEIAKYVEVFFKETPVVLISSDKSVIDRKISWPDSVKGFVEKNKDVYSILKEAMAIGQGHINSKAGASTH